MRKPASLTALFTRGLFGAVVTIGLGGALVSCDTGTTESGDEATETFQISWDEPGTLLEFPEDSITITDKLGFMCNVNSVTSMKYTPGEPRLISGRQIMQKSYVKAKPLRVDRIIEPLGTKSVMVDVSLDGQLPLKSISSTERGTFQPGPILMDDIGNAYYPIGFVLSPVKGGYEVEINPSDPFKDLNALPPLSRSKPQKLKLLFRVNSGVTLTAYSYGGYDKRTFEMFVPKN